MKHMFILHLEPGKRGCRVSNSAMMAPIAHISEAILNYCKQVTQIMSSINDYIKRMFR